MKRASIEPHQRMNETRPSKNEKVNKRVQGRWFTPEFILYFFLLCQFYGYQIPRMFGPLKQKCANSVHCRMFLRRGWLFDGTVDAGDAQWWSYREALPLLFGGAFIYSSVSILIRTWTKKPTPRKFFSLAVSIGFVFFVHGWCALFVFVAVAIAYLLGRTTAGTPLAAPVAWSYMILLLFTKEWFHHSINFHSLLGPSFAWLDGWRGEYAWNQALNLLALRIISFQLDYHSAVQASKGETKPNSRDVKGGHGYSVEYARREREHLPLKEYNLLNVFIHALYVPLYIAGPTITFNAFISQVNAPQRVFSASQISFQILRVLFIFALLECAGHLVPVFAINRTHTYASMTHLELGFLGFITLNVMWLKFTAIWRFARVWALCDGIECVENMVRCMNNNYSVSLFWRGWHRSFNRWLVRYIYLPLGGAKYRWLNVWVVFLFVASWHDFESKLFAWAAMNAAFMTIEQAIVGLTKTSPFAPVRQSFMWRHICAAAGSIWIIVLIVINLVGYSIGLDGIVFFLSSIFTLENISFFLSIFVIYFAAAQVMFELTRTGLSVDGGGI